MGDTGLVTQPAPGPRDVWGPPGQDHPVQGQPAPDPWLNVGDWPDPYNQPRFGPSPGFAPPPGFGPPQPGFGPPPLPPMQVQPKPPKRPREPMQPAALRLAVSCALIVALLAATLGAALTAVYERHHPLAGTVTTITLNQSGAAQPGSPIPGSIAAIAQVVLPSVVTIQERSATVQGTGSGVVIDGPKGLILTNDHVVADAATDPNGGALQVIPAGGTPADALKATIVGTDATTDLAVVHVASTTLKTATLGRSSTLRVGDAVVAIGAPLGLAGTVTSGIVSYLGRNVPVPSETGSGAGNEIVGAIQTDAAINPGNSGGALVDSLGRVIGINSAIASTNSTASTTQTQSGNIGVGFAIPIDEVTQIAAQLIVSPHTAAHPFLGVRTQDNMSPAGAKVSGVSDGTATLPAVTPGSPASKVGLREGDVITAIDGDKVGGADDLLAAIRRHRVGETITIGYSRDGRVETAKVALANTTS